jgi:phage terminase large subunit GpA-like protein
MTVSDWADDNRVLPKGSAEPGPWRTSRVPYMRSVMDAAIDARFRRVVVVAGSQLSKTELLLNIIGYRMDIDPAPLMFISASQRLAESVSTGRVMPMIKSTPSLNEKLDKSKSKLKITEKFISGQRLGFAWAGSSIELSSHPVHTVLIDERDRMASDVEGEGDPVALAEARTATYVDGKVIVCSTPTIEGASPIMGLYQGGTMGRWSWPCPECQTYFVPEFGLLNWDKQATPQQGKRTARLSCPHCGALIADKHRAAMNAAGKYEFSGDLESDCASFWISGLASPWRSWGEAAKQWVEAARSREPSRTQAVLNTTFGEPYKLKGDAPEPSKVQSLRAGYHSEEVPAGVRGITCGVDVQRDKLYYAIRGWGVRSTSWLIKAGELWGETDQQAVWADLALLLEASWGRFRINRMLVDSGYRPDVVYAFARRFPGRVYPAKGHDGQAKPVQITKIDLGVRGQPARRGTPLAHVDASYFKQWVHGRIAWPLDEQGAWHLPIDATDEYCEHIVAESRIVKGNGKVLWVRDGKKPNHWLDCEMLNAAAGHMMNVHLIKPPRQTNPAPTVDEDGAPIVEIAPPPRHRDPLLNPNFGRRRPKNWTRNWR